MIKKIFQFIEGNLKLLGDKFDLLSEHQKEQVLYRLEICKNDCLVEKKCLYCGCSFPGKLYVKKSCNNNERFPDMMNSIEWDKYKEEQNIKKIII